MRCHRARTQRSLRCLSIQGPRSNQQTRSVAGFVWGGFFFFFVGGGGDSKGSKERLHRNCSYDDQHRGQGQLNRQDQPLGLFVLGLFLFCLFVCFVVFFWGEAGVERLMKKKGHIEVKVNLADKVSHFVRLWGTQGGGDREGRKERSQRNCSYVDQ